MATAGVCSGRVLIEMLVPYVRVHSRVLSAIDNLVINLIPPASCTRPKLCSSGDRLAHTHIHVIINTKDTGTTGAHIQAVTFTARGEHVTCINARLQFCCTYSPRIYVHLCVYFNPLSYKCVCVTECRPHTLCPPALSPFGVYHARLCTHTHAPPPVRDARMYCRAINRLEIGGRFGCASG
jgi:hypothetical protein